MKAKAKNPSIKKDDQALTEDELVRLNEVAEDLNSENHADGDIPDSKTAKSPLSEESDDESLDDDQQMAFDRILSQIEGDGAAEADSGSGKKTGDEPESEPADDFSGELEAVVEEADAVDAGDQAEAKSVESADGRDENQPKPLERSMARNEGGGAADEGTTSGKETGDESESEPADDFSSELEKVVQEADPADRNETPAIESTESDGQADEAAQDISDEIDDILKEITSNDDESHLLEAAVDESVAEPANVDALEKTILADDIVAYEKEDHDPEPEEGPQTLPPAGNDGAPTESEETPSAKDPSDHGLADIKPPSASLPIPPKAKPLREAAQSTRGWKKRAMMASVAAILLLTLAGYFYWAPASIVDSTVSPPNAGTSPRDGVVVTQPVPKENEPGAVDQGLVNQSRLETAAEYLERLRNELIEKQAEIEELRAYYQAGINTEIQGI
ncbi:hypothetical protein, partial [Desulfosarcina sp.]|uniref:hypothetical protein n=1 Tax=Desulfosarcina sp. TaxID=2027861 RepID=UPI0029B21F28